MKKIFLTIIVLYCSSVVVIEAYCQTTHLSITTIDEEPGPSTKNATTISTNFVAGYHHEKKKNVTTRTDNDQLKIDKRYELIDGIWGLEWERSSVLMS